MDSHYFHEHWNEMPVADRIDFLLQTQAYIISERRREYGLPGDEHTDWAEANKYVATYWGHLTSNHLPLAR